MWRRVDLTVFRPDWHTPEEVAAILPQVKCTSVLNASDAWRRRHYKLAHFRLGFVV
jgi:hypothetical protein